MSVIFTCKRGPSERLDSLAIENGAVIITTDTKELYMDVNSSRLLVGQIQIVNNLPTNNIENNRIYLLTTNNTFYKYIDSKWVNITNVLMTGASSTNDGKAGMVPAPKKGNESQFLRGDGTWATPTNTTYSDATQSKSGLMSKADKVKLDAIDDGAEVNQNAFSILNVGGTPIPSNDKEDTLVLDAGTNIELVADASNKKITINASVPEYNDATQSTSGLMSKADKVKLDAIDESADVNQNAFSKVVVGDTTISSIKTEDSLTLVSGTNVTLTPDSTGRKVTIAATNTTYSDATQSKSGLMSKADKVKLDNVEAGANKTIVDAALSDTSTNPVQNKIIKAAIDNANARIDNIMDGAEEELNSFKEFKTYLDEHQSEYEALVAISDNKVDKVSGKGLSTNDYTTSEKTKLSGIASGAEVNQNAFSKVLVGETTITSNNKTDTLTVVAGNNVTLTPDASGKKVTIAAKDTTYSLATQSASGLMSPSDKLKIDGVEAGANKYTHPSHTAKSSGMYKITVDSSGHVSAATAIVKSDITGLGIPAKDTTYSNATTSTAGLMSASDKAKLDSINTTFATDEQILALFA